MKRLLSFSIVLVMVLSLFTGCNVMDTVEDVVGDKNLTFGDIKLTVPALYVDLTETVGNDALTFVYGIGDTAVLGMKESRAEIEAVRAEVDTAREYAELVIEANGLQVEVTEKDGIVTYTYTASVEGDEFTYLCGAYANDENFWTVQAYTYSKDFKKNEADFWNILKSVQI